MGNKRFSLVAYVLAVLISVLFSGCDIRNILLDPTPTPTYTVIPSPTPTWTPLPSFTPLPLPTPTYTPFPVPTDQPIDGTNLSLGIIMPIENAGFTIRPVNGYELDDKVENGIAMLRPDGLIFIGFEVLSFDPTLIAIEEMNDAFLEGFTSEIGFSFISSAPYPYVIDGQQALGYDLSSDTHNLKGQSIVLDMDNGSVLYGFGFGLSRTYSNPWTKEGSTVFLALLNTLRFIPVTSGKCTVSTDPTYGYTPENPVKISGSYAKKYFREKQYLAYLRQPYGESVTYQRLGAVEFGEKTLDEFEVTLGNQTVRLYFDFNSSGDLLAPLGFECWGEINVQDSAW